MSSELEEFLDKAKSAGYEDLCYIKAYWFNDSGEYYTHGYIDEILVGKPVGSITKFKVVDRWGIHDITSIGKQKIKIEDDYADEYFVEVDSVFSSKHPGNEAEDDFYFRNPY